MWRHIEADESASSYDSGLTSEYSRIADMAVRKGALSDRSFPPTDLVFREMASFQLPAKGRAIKSKNFVTTTQIELSNPSAWRIV